MKTLIFFLGFLRCLSLASAYEQSVSSQDGGKQLACTTNSCYFAIDVPGFEIYPSEEGSSKDVHIHVYLQSITFPIFYDRPIRKISQTTIKELLKYLYCPNKRDLTLTLMLVDPLKKKSLPLTFRIIKSIYNEMSQKVEFVAKLAQSPATDFLKQVSLPFKGKSSSLLIDG